MAAVDIFFSTNDLVSAVIDVRYIYIIYIYIYHNKQDVEFTVVAELGHARYNLGRRVGKCQPFNPWASSI